MGRKRKKEEINDDDKGSVFLKKVDFLKDKLKLGSHHKMERFIILLSVTFLFMSVFTVTALAKHQIAKSDVVSTQAMFTDKFNFSLSNETGKLLGVFSSEDRKDVMVLFKFERPANMSTDADNYQLFITGKSKKLKYEPKTTFSIFGATGYGVIRFQKDDGFPKDIMNITLRSNKQVGQMSNPNLKEYADDASFSKFDQARLYVNLGAESVTVVEGLNSGENNPVKLYIELIAGELDKAIHADVEKITKELDILQSKADEYESRIINFGYVPPTEPVVIAGDFIDEDGIFRSQTNVVLAYEFDYWSKTIHDGYLKQVIDDMGEYNEYMKKHTDRTQDADVLSRKRDREKVIKSEIAVKQADGSELVFKSIVTGESPSSDVAIKDAYNVLESTWQSYINLKVELQTRTIRQFLVLDADVQTQKVGFSENTSEDVAIYY